MSRLFAHTFLVICFFGILDIHAKSKKCLDVVEVVYEVVSIGDYEVVPIELDSVSDEFEPAGDFMGELKRKFVFRVIEPEILKDQLFFEYVSDGSLVPTNIRDIVAPRFRYSRLESKKDLRIYLDSDQTGNNADSKCLSKLIVVDGKWIVSSEKKANK